MSNQIITPNVWGPHGWKFIHYITMAYPENPTLTQKEKYKVFLLLLKDVLPCSLCAKHYEENLNILPLSNHVLSSRENLVRWGIDIHNKVNESNNKPIYKYEDAIKLIDNNSECKKNIVIIKNNIPSDENKVLIIPNKKINNDLNNSHINTNIIYILLAALIILIFIAIMYKKN
jgi:predicted RND superfamily exporter protein